MTINASDTRARLTEQVAEEIRALLARRRISGRELARRMGASASWVNFRLTGSVEIGLNELQRFAEALDVDIADLLPQREGRVVTHAGATRSQSTVAQVSLPIRHHPAGPRNRAVPPRNRRPVRTAAAAA